MKYPVYNVDNEKESEIELTGLDPEESINSDLLYQVVECLRSRQRIVRAKTKDRSEVSGGGRKPWAQKGTGRARHGSIRSPIWAGGGVTFGPQREKQYKKKINKKMKRKAFRQGLLSKVQDEELKVVEEITLKKPKTKYLAGFLEKLDLLEGPTLILISSPQKDVRQSARNLPRIQVRALDKVNVLDLLHYKNILITKDNLHKLLQQRLTLNTS